VEDDEPSETEREETTGENPTEEEDNSQVLQISMHAISGTASAVKTFPLFITIGSMKLVCLINSGSFASFMDPSVIVKTNLPLVNHAPVKVTIANGNILWTQVVTSGYQYTIQGHQFTTDFRVLDLEVYDLILGCDWIFEFIPMGLNLKTRAFTIEKEGQKICFKDQTLPNAKFLVSHKKMKKMLQKGVVGAVVYLHKLQVQEPNQITPPNL
jgi:hypothetical protein